MTGRQRPFPQLIIGGGMRCGTTALFSYLAKHPQLSASRRKEVHYFDLHFDRGHAWYKRQFRMGKAVSNNRHQLLFESSPYYMYEPRVPQRIHNTIPDARLVFLLRDPIDRAISHYQKNLKDQRECLSLRDALEAEEERLAGEEEKMLNDPHYCSAVHQYFSYKARGRYAILIKRFFRYFPRNQILLIRSSRLFKQPTLTLAEVCDFLGVTRWQPDDYPVVNQSRIKTVVPKHIRDQLESDFEPYERQLEELIGWRSADWPDKK
ncbi:hypothetical protein SYNGFB01_03830 [Synechococcus sp. GFB01]|nr:hypothetical protein SYNGFB01_03830 [Synechococcus sp. GFB01]